MTVRKKPIFRPRSRSRRAARARSPRTSRSATWRPSRRPQLRWRRRHECRAMPRTSASPRSSTSSCERATVGSGGFFDVRPSKGLSMRAAGGPDIAVGDALLSVEDVSLSFGGVKAVSNVSFDIRKGEIRAIIGPNGAGKTSMLNVINGFYHPQQGRITFKGATRNRMRPHEAATGGIARTFQNVALFKGMTALDNIMAGRTLKMHRGLLWQLLRVGPALREEVE